MSSFAPYLLKVILCSGTLYGYYYLALRNHVFHQYNRFYLLAAVLFSLVFPFISLPAFYPSVSARQEITLYELLATSDRANVVLRAGTAKWNVQQIALAAYGFTALYFLVKLVMGLWQIRILLRQSAVEQIGSISFISTNHSNAPFSFFRWLFWKNEIDINSAGGQSIFRHELVHIREHHTLDKLLLQFILIFFWINPFFWIIRRELQLIHEFIADKKAVGHQGTEALAAMILQSVYGKQINTLINPFFQQPIKRRLAMLQKTLKQPRNAYLGRVLTLPFFALLLFAFAKRTNTEKKFPEDKKTASITLTLNQQFVPDTVPHKTPADQIKEVRVNKKDTIKTITITYKNGKQETLTEKEAMARGLITPPPPPPVPGTPPSPPPPPPMNEMALVVIDGKEIGTLGTTENSDKMPKPEAIDRIDVLKGKMATDKYGEKGRYGVIEITTKRNADDKASLNSPNAEALVVVDDEIRGTMKEFDNNNPPVKQELIKSLNILKDKPATDKYGDKGKNGVIEIYTKN